MLSKENLIIIEDDADIAEFIKQCMADEGFNVSIASNGEDALRAIEAEQPDMAILDILLPEIDGFEVLERLRQWSQMPVIALSVLNEMEHKIRCLDLGADDYMTKPFGIEELVARVNAVLRRSSRGSAVTHVIEGNDLQIDFGKRTVTRHGEESKLTPIESSLLLELALNAGEILSHGDLLQKVWGAEYESERAYLPVYTHSLREKIEADASRPKYIITVAGTGYRFVQPN